MSCDTDSNERYYSLERTLHTPSPITSLALPHSGHLCAGAADGSLRVYDLSSFKVLKAIKGLGSEVSSIVCSKRLGTEFRDVWLACGRKVFSFQMDTPKLILDPTDAANSIELGEDDEDDLNELALNSNKTHLAFSLDSGVVGTVELSSNKITHMKVKHKSICGQVRFLPDRPRELVSGGYDETLLHFDFVQGTLLSKRVLPPFVSVGGMGMNLSPPFVMSMALSSSGILAAGTADGRVWLGFGGEKQPPRGGGRRKRTRKWEGLKEDEEVFDKVAEGPIVAMLFSEAERNILTLCTLRGRIAQYHILRDFEEESLELVPLWEKGTENLEKVNALVADDKKIILGGLSKDGTGVIEVWKRT